MNTHKMKVREAVAAIEKMDATSEECEAIYAHELTRKGGSRKGVLSALLDKMEKAPVEVEEVLPKPVPAVIYGEEIVVTDRLGVKHEAVVGRALLTADRPVLAVLKDGKETEILAFHGTEGKPCTWVHK